MTTILHILQHALGRDEVGRPERGAVEDYRNHFCTSPPGKGWDRCVEAVNLGLMTQHEPRAISGGDWIFTVTDAGKAYIAEHSPAPPKISRSQARYLRFLDEDSSMSFGEWLTVRA